MNFECPGCGVTHWYAYCPRHRVFPLLTCYLQGGPSFETVLSVREDIEKWPPVPLSEARMAAIRAALLVGDRWVSV